MPRKTRVVRLYSVVTPIEGGLYGDLLPDFERTTGYQVKLTGRSPDVYGPARAGKADLVISTVNLAEVLIHTAQWSRSTGGDAVALLRASGVAFHSPDESVTRRVAKLRTSLTDGFAAATAQELRARLHTTDTELMRQIEHTGIPVSRY